MSIFRLAVTDIRRVVLLYWGLCDFVQFEAPAQHKNYLDFRVLKE
jgi:hypothetical protein